MPTKDTCISRQSRPVIMINEWQPLKGLIAEGILEKHAGLAQCVFQNRSSEVLYTIGGNINHKDLILSFAKRCKPT